VGALLEFDRGLFMILNGRAWPVWLDRFFVFITEEDNWRIPIILLWLLLLVACGPRWRRRALWLVPLIAITDSFTSQVLKELVGRVRPCHDELEGLRLLVGCGPGLSFPSNHAANMGAVGIWIAFGLRSLRLRPLILILPVLVAYSRVHVGVHYPLDIVVGFLEGSLLAWGAEHALRRLPPRWGLGHRRALGEAESRTEPDSA
jgi:undecaprenyl-diphosphatase